MPKNEDHSTQMPYVSAKLTAVILVNAVIAVVSPGTPCVFC